MCADSPDGKGPSEDEQTRLEEGEYVHAKGKGKGRMCKLEGKWVRI